MADIIQTRKRTCAPAQPRERAAPRDVSTAAPVSADAAVPAPEDAASSVDAASPVDEPSSVDAANSLDSGVAVTECPATYGGGAACAPTGKKCEYPDGSCTCAGGSHCGGAQPHPDLLAELAAPRWICEPSPKKLGPNGCPLGLPVGRACTTPGKQCRYTQCCSVNVTCSGGKWVSGPPSCPP